jgi:hypothetical protein
MFKNIHNALSDTVMTITENHFPLQEEYVDEINGWHTINFKNEQGHTLKVEVQIDDANQSLIMSVLSQNGFTNDQMNIIMDTFEASF